MPGEFGIRAVAYAFPGPSTPLSVWAKETGLAEEALTSLKANRCEQVFVAKGKSAADLALAAATELASDGSFPAPEEIDLVIHTATQQICALSPPDSTPARIRHALGLRNAGAFSIFQMNCTSHFGAIVAATAYLRARPERRFALITTADKVFGEAYRNRGGSGIQSDAGAALLLERNCSRNRIARIELLNVDGLSQGSDGSAEALRRMRFVEYRATVQVLRRCLGHTPARMLRLIPPNTDGAVWPMVSRLLGRDEDFAYVDNIPRYGHACCADTFINLTDGNFLDPAPGDGVVACTLSNVGAYGAMTLVGAPAR